MRFVSPVSELLAPLADVFSCASSILPEAPPSSWAQCQANTHEPRSNTATPSSHGPVLGAPSVARVSWIEYREGVAEWQAIGRYRLSSVRLAGGRGNMA